MEQHGGNTDQPNTYDLTSDVSRSIVVAAVVEVVKILVDRVNLVDRAAVGVLLHLARVVLVRRDKVFLEVAPGPPHRVR
jgi:ABC-type transporter Mla MlaB component